MNPIQLWADATKNLISSAIDDKDRTILQLLCSQVMLNISNNMVVFVCDSPYIQSLFVKYREIICQELIHLIGRNDLFFMTEIGSVKQNNSSPQIQDNFNQFNNQVNNNQNQSQGLFNQQYNHPQTNSNNQISQKADSHIVVPNVSVTNNLKSTHLAKKPRFMREDIINKNKTFDNYVTDPKNTMLVAAAVSVALNPGTSNYNPFYIFGGSGLGKTHLLFAIANRIKETRPDFSLIYTRAEEFIRHYVESMANPKNLRIDDQQVHFQDLYTEHNVFIVDDIQNFIKAANARETFFDIIAEFLDRPNRQLILASDVPPGNLKDFSTRLTSRFGSGVCCEVVPPSVETRQAITLTKCKELNVHLSDEIINYIATHIRSNVREIEGAIKTLNTHISAYGNISYEDAVKNLANLVNASNQVLTIDTIKERVAKEFEVSVSSMESAERKKAVSNARSMAMALARDLIPNVSYSDIGRAFNKDHSSVYEAINRIKKRISEDVDTSSKYHRLHLSLKKE